MNKKATTTPIEAYIQADKRMEMEHALRPIVLDMGMIYKEQLDKYEGYLYLKEKLNGYIKKLKSGVKLDEYEVRIYEKLYQLMFDLKGVGEERLIENQIENTKKWLGERQERIKSRMKQGNERVAVTSESRKIMMLFNKINSVPKEPKGKKAIIPSQTIEEALMPYLKKWRTLHPDSELPLTRLNYRQTKRLQLQPFLAPTQNNVKNYSMLGPNVSYVIPPPTIQNDSILNPKLDDDGKDAQTQIDQQYPSISNSILLPQQIIVPNDPVSVFGQQPQQQNNDSSQQQNQGLIPKTKLYASDTKDQNKKSISQKNSFMNIKQKLDTPQRRLELKFKNNRAKQLIQKNEDLEMVALTENRIKSKSTVVKQQQKRLEIRMSKPQYAIYEQEAQEQFKLADHLQRKYNLSQTKIERRYDTVDLRINLPKLNSGRSSVNIHRQKPILSNLKKRYSAVLNLSPSASSRDPSPAPQSIAQFTSRTKAVSQFLDLNNKKIQRQSSLKQFQTVRQKFKTKKISVDVKTLLSGLCVPQQSKTNLNQLPSKGLLHNQFMIKKKSSKKTKK